MLSYCGGRRKTSSTWKPLLNSSGLWLCRTISLRPTIASALSWRTSDCLSAPVKCMNERGQFHPRKAVSHSILQVYVWNHEYDLAREEIEAWSAESPENKYPIYFAIQLALMTGDLREARALLDEAVKFLPEEPLIVSLEGVYFARIGLEREGARPPDDGLCKPKIFWACASQPLSDRLYSCSLKPPRSCV